MPSNSADLVLALVRVMDPYYKIWEKWPTLSDELSHLKDMGKDTEAWDLLLKTAIETDP